MAAKRQSQPRVSVRDELAQARDQLLQAERDCNSLRLELEDKERQLRALQLDLESGQKHATTAVAQSVESRLEALIEAVSGPTAQLITQTHLLRAQGKPVQANDVLVVANKLIGALRSHGLETQGEIGESVGFDINMHEPLGVDEAIAAREPVIVCMVGIAYRGRVLRRASVTRQPVGELSSR